MDISVTVNEIKALSIPDRIRIVQEILESIAVEQAYLDLTTAQKRELDRRITDYETNPENVMT
ncbi:addiction module protein [Anabaena sp. PCC 7108]|uniref:addiction module protein n=1 Tax=Anabaena sp. PCC 7108 TaxID=163908 RepID=UPI00034538B6|nr:addiction module protein [Anabaena sp. PCC 7108]